MTTAPQFPLDLCKAHLELQATLAGLLQESCRDWLAMGETLAEQRIARHDELLAALHRSADWQALASWPAGLALAQVRQRFGDGQELARVAFSVQDKFGKGLQVALREWQASAAEALQGAASVPASGSAEASTNAAVAAESAWTLMLRPWQQALDLAAAGARRPAWMAAR